MYKIIIILFGFICSFLSAGPPEQVFLPTRNFKSSYPYITGDTIREKADHILDPTQAFNPLDVKLGDTIFVMYDYLEYFFEEFHAKIPNPYLLITHHFYGTSDDPIPNDKYAIHLEDEKLIAWFTHNADRINEKLYPLPLGIGPAFYSYGNTTIFDSLVKKAEKNNFKKNLLYMNFSVHTCPAFRQPVFDIFKNAPFCKVEKSNMSLDRYLEQVIKHKFILSPRGNGLDCFRTWESLLMKTYPIVVTSTIDKLFDDLPVLIINDWSEITEEFLILKYIELSQKKYKWEKCYLPYWLNQIKQVKLNFIEQSTKK